MRKPNNLQEKVVYDGINAITELIIGTIIMTILILPIILMKNM